MKTTRYERGFETGGDKPLKRDQVAKAVVKIWNEHSRRKKRALSPDDGGDTKNESAKNFLRREVYALGVQLLRVPPNWDISELLQKMGRTTTRPDVLNDVFRTLLFCVYESDQGITRQDRSLIAMELEYARRHGVPAELLCGFLCQSTERRELSGRLAEGYIEPAFRPFEANP